MSRNIWKIDNNLIKSNIEGSMKKCWLNGKTILITGASSGIGKSLTELFITRNNCNVIGVGRSKEKFAKFVDELGDKKDKFRYILMDVGVEDDWIKLKESVKDTPIDIIINNAGILPPFESFENFKKRNKDISVKSALDKVMDVNFSSIVYSCGYMSEVIEKNSTPAIINIASSSALCPLPGISIYSASKSACKNFTECLMLEKKYYVSLICPGFTKSDIFRYQKSQKPNKLVDMVATNLNKMAYKIYRAIVRKKRRCVFGFDAKCMDRLYRLAPKKSPKLFGKILKKSKIELFDDVFE